MSALIDTGAPTCVFPLGAAKALGFDMSRVGFQHTVEMVGREMAAEYKHVTLELHRWPGHHWEAEVAFLAAEWPMNFGVLGHRGFLDRWAVTFNAYKTYFVVEQPSEFEERLPQEAARPLDPYEEFQSQFHDSEWERPSET